MAFPGKQLKNGTVANSKLATASATAAADAVVVSGSDTKIDISYIPVDDEILRRNFSYTTLASTDVVTVPAGQTMLILNDLSVGDGTLIVDGLVAAVEPDLVNIRPWEAIVSGTGPHTLVTGYINRYDNSLGDAMVLHLPASPSEGDVIDIKEVAESASSVTLTTASGSVLIEPLTGTTDTTSVTLATSKLYLSYKWDAASAVWRIIGSLVRGGSTSALTEDSLTTLATTVDNDPISASGLTATPNALSTIMVHLNGVLINHISYGSKTGSLYFSNDGGTTAALRSAVAAGTKPYWNGSVAGFEISSGWVLKVIYVV